MATSPERTILIVDDIPENVSILFEFLTSQNFKVLIAQNGETALKRAEYAAPQMILLDIMMPGIDGFETCRRLKNNPKTQEIPVIFMTALNDTADKVKGLELGAVDYITKPFQQLEVLARINSHLTIRNLQKALQAQNAELDAFAHTVAHDLKTPLNAIINYSDMLLEDFGDALSDEGREYAARIKQSGRKMGDIIESLLLLAGVAKQSVNMNPVDMKSILLHVYDRLAYMLQQSQGEIILPDTFPIAYGYAPWIEEIWANYLSNGLKYGGKPPRLEIGSTLERDSVRFWVKDNGAGINSEAKEKLFTPFTQLKPEDRKKGHGLGLSIVQRIVERMNGKAGVDSEVGKGSIFYFTLPISG